MTRSGGRARAAAAAVALAAGVAGCGGAGDTGGAGTLRGRISIDGSSTVAPITEAIAEEFRIEQSRVEAPVATSGTGGGFERFCKGEIDIADASRAIKDAEKQACAQRGVEYVELRIGLDGLAIVTSAENKFLRCLSLEQLALIFKEGGASRWDEVDPELPAKKIAIFAPGTDSGTYDFFVEEVLGDPDDPASLEARSDYTASENDNTLVQGIAGERNSWGYFGFAYFKENESVLKAIAVAGEDGTCVEPSDATVESGDYPLSRPLFIYVKKASLARPEVREFVRFYLEVTPEIIADVGYTAVPAEEYAKGLDQLGAGA